MADEMQTYLNEFYNQMAKKMFNVSNHRFEIKKETVARRAIFVTKKRYAQWLIMSKGKIVDKLNVKGLDMVRSSFPKAFKILMKKILTEILNDSSRESITNLIVTFKKELYHSSALDVAKSSSVNSWDDWAVDNPDRLFEFKKSTPAHIKAAIAYNRFLHHFKCPYKYDPVRVGDKIKWVWLRNNPYGLDALAFREDSSPPEIIELIDTYVDRGMMFETELQKKLQQFYDTLKWGTLVSDKTASDTFFSFD